MEQERPFQERRKYVRLKAVVEVKYTVIGKPGEINVFSKDVSAGGLCIIAEEELAPDTPLELEVKVPDLKDSIRALGRVVWQTKFEAANEQTKVFFNTGVEFTGISDFDRFNLNRYVIERAEEAK